MKNKNEGRTKNDNNKQNNHVSDDKCPAAWRMREE